MAPIGKMADNIILVDETEVYEENAPVYFHDQKNSIWIF